MPAGSVIRLSVELTPSSETILKKGDWRSAMFRPCLRASPRTGSPVELAKSAMTIVSVSLSRFACTDR